MKHQKLRKKLIISFEDSRQMEFTDINAKILKKIFSSKNSDWLYSVNLERKKFIEKGEHILQINVFAKP